jgi:two-component system, response regulator
MSHKTILLVEDNPDDETLILSALQHCRSKTDAVITHDGVEALDYIYGRGKYAQRGNGFPLPNLVLLDLKSPGMAEMEAEVLQQLRANPETYCIPVVILTTSKDNEDVVNSYNLGANSYIHKQEDHQRLATILQQMCTYWLDLNEMPFATFKI